jgi:hypothetical protein
MKHFLLIAAVFISTISFSQKRDKSFDAYWPSFRKAVLALDVAALDSLTVYPVSVRGTMDSDPIRKIPKAKIIATLKKYLPIDGGVGDGTHQQQIESRTVIPLKDYEYSSPGNMRIGDMQFKKVKGKWKFYFMYLDEE